MIDLNRIEGSEVYEFSIKGNIDTESIKEFDKNNIEIPFPQRTATIRE